MIINSLLDTDFYKYSMGQMVFHFQPKRPKIAEYSMKCRSGNDLTKFQDQLKKEIDHFLSLKLTEDELNYLDQMVINTKVFKADYIQFLREMDLKKHIEYKIVIEDGQLNIRVKGDWKYSIFAEIPMLAIVQELYWKNELSATDCIKAEEEFAKRLEDKIKYLKTTNIKFAEFGTRRRFSLNLQRLATQSFKEAAPNHLIGTSNVLLAKEFGINPSGSQGHELYQGWQSIASSFETSQKEALEAWIAEYPDKLKIALTDIFGTDIFLLDFTKNLANDFSGTRQDSGVPRDHAHKMKKHYDRLGIDSKTKTMLFSDDLNFVKANDLEVEFRDMFNVLFGIGTFCSNDTGYKPVSVVMKMVRMNGVDVIKKSDSEGKVMCENPDVIKSTNEMIEKRLRLKQ